MYSIGQVSAMFDIPVSTLRYYDKEGLFPNLQRSGNARRFGEDELELLRVIECLKQTGLEIKEIKEFVGMIEEGPSTYAARKELFQARKAQTEADIARMRKALAMVEFKCWYYDTALADGDEERLSAMIPDALPPAAQVLYDRAHGVIKPWAEAANFGTAGCAEGAMGLNAAAFAGSCSASDACEGGLGGAVDAEVGGSGSCELRDISEIVQAFAPALDLLDDYDHQCLRAPKGREAVYVLTYEECRAVIDGMRFGSESAVFGVEKDDSFRGSIGNIYQSFAGQDIYPSLQEKAANLLYLVVKNHSFHDGNKRIAAAMFLYFLDRSNALFVNGEKVIADSALVAATIMIAESKPEEKDAMVALVMNFLAMGGC